MKTLMRIKWENIMLMLTAGVTGSAWALFVNSKEIHTLGIALMGTVMIIVLLIEHKFLKEFRQQVLELWQ